MGTSCEIYEAVATTGEQAKAKAKSKGCQFTSQITFATEGEIF